MYDVLIVGAGPAGSAAAFHVSRLGLRVLLLDRSPFPRAKTCGDGLTPRALAALERMGIERLPGQSIRALQVIHLPSGERREDDFRTQGPPHAGVVVSRATLDELLVRRAREAGADFRVARVRRVLSDRSRTRGVVLDDGTVIAAPTLILAAGPAGQGLLQGGPRPVEGTAWGVAARCYLAVRRPVGDSFEFYLPIECEGDVLAGYGWIFPAGPDRVNIGAGVAVARPGAGSLPSVRRLVERFIADRLARDARLRDGVPCSQIESAPIPLGPPMPARCGLIAVGDCASVPYGLSGEGISQALESGELAAQALAARGDDPVGAYRRLANARFSRHLRLAPALHALHAQPWVGLGRGWDLLCATEEETVGRALWSVIWDTRGKPQPQAAWRDVHVSAAVEATRTEIIRGGRRLRPLLAELLTALVDAPQSAFGWYTALAAATRAAIASPAPEFPEKSRTAMVILETIGLAVLLHSDMPEATSGESPAGTWGRRTLSLVLADCLTARALELLSRLDAPLARFLANVAQHAFRNAADAHGRSTVSGAVTEETQRHLLAAALTVGAAADGHPLHTASPVLQDLARCLAAARSSRAAADEALKVSLALGRPLRTVVEDVLARTGSRVEASSPPSNPQQLVAG